MRLPSAGALRCALAALVAAALAGTVAAAPAQARTRAVIAFLPAGPGATRALLGDFAARGMAIGMTSPTVGGFDVRQMGLDMSQGARIPLRLYSGPIGSLRPRGDHLEGWDLAWRRARRAPGDLVPGLLASTIERAGGRVGYSVAGRGFSVTPIVAANQRGGVSPLQPGDTLTVVQLPPGAAGLRRLDGLLRARGNGFLYVVQAPSGTTLRLLPSAVAAPGIRGQLWSATTRRNGLIAATDIAPSVLRALGARVPGPMQGEPIEGRGHADAQAVARMAARLAVVAPRRGDVLLWLVGLWLVVAVALTLAAGPTGRRIVARIGLLAALWVPGLALLTAALRPSRLVESLVIAGGAIVLGALTDRFARWPLAPAVPAVTVFAAHAIDLVAGSQLIGDSLAGSNPAGGSRFFGIGNELEALLSVSVLVGAGGALAWHAERHGDAQSQRTPVVFALAALVAAGIMGAGRLGADVGAVITLGAGGAAAVIASLPQSPTRRTVALAVAAPALALAALIVLDLATGGGAHLTRTVLHANGSGGVVDVIRRRFEDSFTSLGRPARAAAFALALVAIVWLATRGRRVLAAFPRPFAAGLIGAWFATVVGALANDSGPLILEIGAILLLLAFAYATARPRTAAAPPG